MADASTYEGRLPTDVSGTYANNLQWFIQYIQDRCRFLEQEREQLDTDFQKISEEVQRRENEIYWQREWIDLANQFIELLKHHVGTPPTTIRPSLTEFQPPAARTPDDQPSMPGMGMNSILRDDSFVEFKPPDRSYPSPELGFQKDWGLEEVDGLQISN